MSSFTPLPQRILLRRKRRMAGDHNNCTKNDNNPAESLLIDGSILEGGGQIFRNSVCFGALLRKSVHIIKIRAGRKKPGLRNQHFIASKLICDIIENGNIENGFVGSTDVKFLHSNNNICRNNNKRREIVADCKTGSITLILQAALPILEFCNIPTKITINGGTTVSFSPPINFYKYVYMPILKNEFGIQSSINVLKEGYMPSGKGQVTVSNNIHNTKNNVNHRKCLLKPIHKIEFGAIASFSIYITCFGNAWQAKHNGQNLYAHTIQNIKDYITKRANDLIKMSNGNNDDGSIDDSILFSFNDDLTFTGSMKGSGIAIQIVSKTTTGCFLSGNSLLQPKYVNNSKIGVEAATQAMDVVEKEIQVKSCVGEHLSDQLLLFMCLADGISKIKIRNMRSFTSKHLKTGIHVVKQFLPNIKITLCDCDSDGGQTQILTVVGVGLRY